jgi:hypothetical protein
LLEAMAVARLPSRSLTLSTRPSVAPPFFERVLGRMLVLMIHAVERMRDSRDSRARLAR